jgi:hypothetical protein
MNKPDIDHDHDDAAYAVTEPVDLRSMLAEERAAEPPPAKPQPPQLRPGFRTDDQRAALERGDKAASELLHEFRFAAPRALHQLAYGHLPWFTEPAWRSRMRKMTTAGLWFTERLGGNRHESVVFLSRKGAKMYGGVAPFLNSVETARRGWLRSMAWIELKAAAADYHGPPPPTSLQVADSALITSGLSDLTTAALSLARTYREEEGDIGARRDEENRRAETDRLPLEEVVRRNNMKFASLTISTRACARNAPSGRDVTASMEMFKKLADDRLRVAHDYVRYDWGRRLWLLVDDQHRSIEDQVDDLAAVAFGLPAIFKTARLSNEVLFRPVDLFSVWNTSTQTWMPQSDRCEKFVFALKAAGFVLVDLPGLHLQARQ